MGNSGEVDEGDAINRPASTCSPRLPESISQDMKAASEAETDGSKSIESLPFMNDIAGTAPKRLRSERARKWFSQFRHTDCKHCGIPCSNPLDGSDIVEKVDDIQRQAMHQQIMDAFTN